jgi:hypothetical protein
VPVQIDRLDTSVEITSPAPPAGAAAERRTTTSTPEPGAHAALRDVVGQIMSDELDRFLRNRGM